MKNAVTVVIPARSAEHWHTLVRAVASARSQTVPPAEVVVVADHNPKLFRRVRRDLAGVTVLENAYLPGLAGARNTGAFHAQTSLIAFLDDDTVADPEWLARLVPAFADAGVLGTAAGRRPEWHAGRPRWLPDEFRWAAGTTAARDLEPSGMVLRRGPFRQVGGFGTGAGLCPRMSDLTGGQWTPVAEPLLRHLVPAHGPTFGSFLRRCYREGRAGVRPRIAVLRGQSPLRAGAALAGTVAAGLGIVTVRRSAQPALEPAR